MSRHRTTDPACINHRPPTSRLARWRYERARGRVCLACGDTDRSVYRELAEYVNTGACPCPMCQHARRRA